MWCARRDSNPQPLGSKPSTLSIELRARIATLEPEISHGRSYVFCCGNLPCVVKMG